MTDERHIELAERMLRDTPAPVDPPPALHDRARAEAIEGATGGVVRAFPRRRAGLLAGLGAAATAAAVAIAVSLGGGDGDGGWTVELAGSGDAWGRLEVGEANGTFRPVTLRVDGLPPARGERWYEMWYATDSGGEIPVVSFKVPDSGEAVVETTVPSGISWKRCWVALKQAQGQPKPVLTSN